MQVLQVSRAIRQVTGPCRASLIVLVLASLVLLGQDEAAESLAALCDRHERSALGFLVLMTCSWGFTSWYLARVSLRFEWGHRAPLSGRARELRRWLVIWLPRSLGVVPI